MPRVAAHSDTGPWACARVLSLRSLADSSPTAAPVDEGEGEKKGLSIVRYGVVSTVVNR